MQDRLKTKAEAPSGTQLWLLLMKAFHSVSRYAAQTLAQTGLGDSDFRVLEALLHKGPLAVNVLGPKVFLTPGSISVAVDRLHRKGLVSRTESSKDRRVRVVALTPKGRKLIEQVFNEHAAQMDALAEGMTAKERRRLADGLKLFGKRAATGSASADRP